MSYWGSFVVIANSPSLYLLYFLLLFWFRNCLRRITHPSFLNICAVLSIELFIYDKKEELPLFLTGLREQVYHSAWRELCEGMAAAGSLDEVIEVHEAYLLSIQRQCFVVPDKLVCESLIFWVFATYILKR